MNRMKTTKIQFITTKEFKNRFPKNPIIRAYRRVWHICGCNLDEKYMPDRFQALPGAKKPVKKSKIKLPFDISKNVLKKSGWIFWKNRPERAETLGKTKPRGPASFLNQNFYLTRPTRYQTRLEQPEPESSREWKTMPNVCEWSSCVSMVVRPGWGDPNGE